jgi:mannose-6-phosphate isomerase-like protein (cupin superfamily)
MGSSKPVVVQEAELPFEGWDDAPGAVRWRTLISGDRTPTSSLTVGVAELQPGEAKEPKTHRHAQPEVYYVLCGEGVVRVADRDHPLRAGTTVFIPGNVEHGAIATGKETLRILYAFPADSFGDVEYVFS